MKGQCGNSNRKIGPKSCYFLGLEKMIEPPWISAQLMQELHRTNAVLYAHLENVPALGVSQGIGSPERC